MGSREGWEPREEHRQLRTMETAESLSSVGCFLNPGVDFQHCSPSVACVAQEELTMGSGMVGTVGLANGGRGERARPSGYGWSGLICTPELLVLTVLVTVVLAWSSHHLSPVGPLWAWSRPLGGGPLLPIRPP